MTRCHAWRAQVASINDLCHTICKENMWLTKNGEKGGSRRDKGHATARGVLAGVRQPRSLDTGRENTVTSHSKRVLRGRPAPCLGFLPHIIPASRGGEKCKTLTEQCSQPSIQGMANMGNWAQNNPLSLDLFPCGSWVLCKLCPSCVNPIGGSAK